MKSFMLSIAVALLVFTSGCMSTRRHVPTMARGQLGYQQQPYGYQPGYGPGYGQYGYQQPGYRGGYGYNGAQVPAMFVSEYAGSTYDPRTAGAVVQAEMAREQARRSAQVAAPTMQRVPICPNCTSAEGAEGLNAVMDEVDALRQEVDGR